VSFVGDGVYDQSTKNLKFNLRSKAKAKKMMSSHVVRHMFVDLRTGLRMHVVEGLPSGTGKIRETLICVHGFPDTWFGYRKQIPALASAGYRVLVPDMRGYGSSSPVFPKKEEYSMEKLCEDVVALLDVLMIEKCIMIGHDWGGTLVWNFAMHHRDRTKGVAAFCTPLFPWKDENPWPKVKNNVNSRFNYQIWFQTKEAEEELERDYERTVKCMIRGTRPSDLEEVQSFFSKPWRPTFDGGVLANYSKDVKRSEILTDNDVKEYAMQFARSGFFGILSWYRNVEENWKWNARTANQRITVPALMVTAANDATLPPSMTKHMPKWIDDFTQHNIQNAGHWILQEQPGKCNSVLIKWLNEKFPSAKSKASL